MGKDTNMRKDVASQVNKLMLDFGAKLDESVMLVMNSCTDQEFEAYRSAVGNLMGCILLDIMNPIYREHPDLWPPQLNS